MYDARRETQDARRSSMYLYYCSDDHHEGQLSFCCPCSPEPIERFHKHPPRTNAPHRTAPHHTTPHYTIVDDTLRRCSTQAPRPVWGLCSSIFSHCGPGAGMAAKALSARLESVRSAPQTAPTHQRDGEAPISPPRIRVRVRVRVRARVRFRGLIR